MSTLDGCNQVTIVPLCIFLASPYGIHVLVCLLVEGVADVEGVALAAAERHGMEVRLASAGQYQHSGTESCCKNDHCVTDTSLIWGLYHPL